MTRDSHSAQPSPRIEELAARYLERVEMDGSADLEPFLVQLDDEASRAALRMLVETATSALELFPRRLQSGVVVAERYRIGALLGAGGMGRVFEALDLRLGRRVALKVMHGYDLDDPARRALFERESLTLARLQHPGIVAVHDHGRFDDLSYFAMDLVDGTPLDQVIGALAKIAENRGSRRYDGADLSKAIGREALAGRESLIEPTGPRSVARITLEIARAVSAAHHAGVLHRDLKPSNVLLLGGGHPVVVDFGLAGQRDTRQGAVTEGLFGTVAYLAPEQVRTFRAGADARTDIYQLGLLLYELLALERAFPGNDTPALLEAIRAGAIRAPHRRSPGLPRDLDAICLKALENSPDARYASADELCRDLERFLRNETPDALHTHRARRAWSTARALVRRHRVATSLVVGVALAIAGTVAWKNAHAAPPLGVSVAFARLNSDNVRIDDLTSIEPTNKFAAYVTCSNAARVYAASVFGGAERDTKRFYPVPPWVAEAYLQQSGTNVVDRPPACAGLDIPLGTTLTLIDTIGVDAPAYEGVWVIVAPPEEQWIRPWLESISNAAPKGVPLDTALEQLRNASATRGDSIGAPPVLSESERRNLLDDLRRAVDPSVPIHVGRAMLWRIELPVHRG